MTCPSASSRQFLRLAVGHGNEPDWGRGMGGQSDGRFGVGCDGELSAVGGALRLAGLG